MTGSTLDKADPYLAAIKSLARGLRATDPEAYNDIEKPRARVVDALRTGDAQDASIWMNTLEAAVLSVKGGSTAPIQRAMKALAELVTKMPRKEPHEAYCLVFQQRSTRFPERQDGHVPCPHCGKDWSGHGWGGEPARCKPLAGPCGLKKGHDENDHKDEKGRQWA